MTAFRIDPGTGALVEIGAEVPAGDAPSSIAVDPSGRFVYVTNLASDDVTTYGIDQATGALTEVGTETAAGNGPQGIAILRARE